jgi:lysophospholipase L1-like esterase
VPPDAAPSSFVALGDSFTEGLDDPAPDRGAAFRGWADRVAEGFAAAREGDFRYANLAVRGRKLDAILAEQLPRAIGLAPQLVSLAGGTNDVLRPRVDLDAMAERFEDAVRRLRANGSQVMLFQSVDPTPRSRLIASALPRIKTLTTMVEEVADRHSCILVRLWGAPAFAHPTAWSVDRLHLSAEGHARVAGAVREALGLGDHSWAADVGPYDRGSRSRRLAADVSWTRHHLVPWVGRRLRGTSTGDGRTAKYPDLVSFPPSSAAT